MTTTQAQWITNGNAWGHPHKVKDALCFDGKRRTVRLNQQADSAFSWSGRCNIKGKTVCGYVTGTDNGDTAFRLYDCEWTKIGIEKPSK